MVVSHYSTTYLAIALLAIAAVFQWGVSWFRPVPRVTGTVLLALVVSAAGAAVWYGSIDPFLIEDVPVHRRRGRPGHRPAAE